MKKSATDPKRCQKAGCSEVGCEYTRFGIGGRMARLCEDHDAAWGNDTEAWEHAQQTTLCRIAVDGHVNVGRVDEATKAADASFAQERKNRAYVESWLARIG